MSSLVESDIRCIAQTRDVCGEGVVWHPTQNAVYWTDINRAFLHRLVLNTGNLKTWTFDQPVTAVALTTDPDTLVVVLGGCILLWKPDADTPGTVLYQLPDWPASRCNDAKAGPGGELWIGTMQNNVAADRTTVPITSHQGQLISIDRRGHTALWRDGIGISNTVAWSPGADSMYFGDTLRNEIYRYQYDKVMQSVALQGTFSSGFPRGLPDGSAVDAEGFLWNCRYGGSCIVRFAPDGSVDAVVETPVQNPTTCAFGGDDLRTLYFTSAGEGRLQAEPIDGGLFSMRTAVAGLPTTPFRLS